jgi:hypothetical protein
MSPGRVETERSSLAPALAAGSNAAALAPPTSEDLLQFELAIDTERERIVLYRVLIVVEVLALLVFARFLWL